MRVLGLFFLLLVTPAQAGRSSIFYELPRQTFLEQLWALKQMERDDTGGDLFSEAVETVLFSASEDDVFGALKKIDFSPQLIHLLAARIYSLRSKGIEVRGVARRTLWLMKEALFQTNDSKRSQLMAEAALGQTGLMGAIIQNDWNSPPENPSEETLLLRDAIRDGVLVLMISGRHLHWSITSPGHSIMSFSENWAPELLWLLGTPRVRALSESRQERALYEPAFIEANFLLGQLNYFTDKFEWAGPRKDALAGNSPFKRDSTGPLGARVTPFGLARHALFLEGHDFARFRYELHHGKVEIGPDDRSYLERLTPHEAAILACTNALGK